MKRVLILEDDAALRRTLARALEGRGHQVKEVPNLTSLAEAIEGACFDWAILDLGLPDGSGLEAVTTLVSQFPPIRIAMLTGYGSIPSAVEAVRRGALDYLSKPADVDQILGVLDDGTDPDIQTNEPQPASLQRVEWEHIQRVLADHAGNITRAAEVLGIHRRTLQRKLSYRPPSK